MKYNRMTDIGQKSIISRIMLRMIICYCVLFPADKLNIKEIILFLTLFMGIPNITNGVKRPENTLILFYGVVYPVFVFFTSIIIGDSNVGSCLSYDYVWIYLLLIFPIVDLNVNIKVPFLLATTIVAFMIDFIYLTDLFGIISIYNNPVIEFFSSMNEMQWGKGELATFGYSIFFKSSPLIVLTLGYAIYNKKYIWTALLFLSLLASGTRANFLIGVMLIVLIPLLCWQNTISKKMIIIAVILVIAINLVPILLEKFTALNELKYSRSESIKYEAIKTIISFMNEHPYRYLFGSGVGSSFYFPARHSDVNVVEVSYFDYFRQVGIVGFSFFIFFLVKPLKWLMKTQKWLVFSYIGYLMIAFTNPLLVTSTSFMLYLMILTNGMGEKRISILSNEKCFVEK